MKSNSDKNQTKLPWWVELLFVQIGLPDSWLSKYLKKKKETYNFINENKKNIFYCTLIIAGVLYIYPIVSYTSSSSSCIDKTTKYLKKKKEAYNFINENKKYLFYSLVLISGVLYIYPIVKYTSSSASCIDKTTKYLKSNNVSKTKNEMDLNSLAVGYCHGGSLPK